VVDHEEPVSAAVLSDDRLEELWSSKRYELTVDYVSVWEILRLVHRMEPQLDGQAARDTVLTLIERALDRSEAEIGTWPRGRQGLEHVWHEPTDVIIDRIRREWIALGRDPMPGEVAWLQRPGLGTGYSRSRRPWC
jgi:hypothetical protein